MKKRKKCPDLVGEAYKKTIVGTEEMTEDSYEKINEATKPEKIKEVGPQIIQDVEKDE